EVTGVAASGPAWPERCWRVDERAHTLMMCRDAGSGKFYGQGIWPVTADRPRRRRWRVAAALLVLRRDRRRTGCAVRPMLERDQLLRAAVVRALRYALSPSDGRRCALRPLCA